MPDHTHGALDDIATEINSSNVEVEQRQDQFGIFRVNLNIAYIDSTFIRTTSDTESKFSIPFTLPPLQEDFSITTSAIGTQTPGVAPTYVLDEVAISFDQRCEGGVIADFMHKGLSVGTITSNGVAAGDTFTINGIVFTAVFAAANPALQQFEDLAWAGTNIAVANSIIATINHPTSQALIAGSAGNNDGVYVIADDNNTAAVPVRASRGGNFLDGTLSTSNPGTLPIVQFAVGLAGNQSPEGGRLDFSANTDAYDLGFSLLEKTPYFFDNSIVRPEREVISADLQSLSFIGSRRDNPYVISDIGKVIDPYRTYVAQLNVHSLNQLEAGDPLAFWHTYALVNVVISMRFKAKLVARDSGVGTVQNIPTIHDGTKTSRSVSITVPPVGTEIEADGADGFNTALADIDEVFQTKMNGGYNRDSSVPVEEDLAEESCYEIIAVPIFQNTDEAGLTAERVLDAWPWVGTNVQPVDDRTFVRITYPFALHHVVIAYNWQGWLAPISTTYGVTQAADGPNFSAEFGIGLGEGLRSDNYDYTLLANDTLIGPRTANWDLTLIDRIRTSEVPLATDGTGLTLDWDLELHQIRLVGAGGTGYYAQGQPIFIGEANWPDTNARANVNAVAPPTGGREQFIEVRCRLEDAVNGIDNATAGGGQSDGSILTGYQGHWVFLIGKKTCIL